MVAVRWGRQSRRSSQLVLAPFPLPLLRSLLSSRCMRHMFRRLTIARQSHKKRATALRVAPAFATESWSFRRCCVPAWARKRLNAPPTARQRKDRGTEGKRACCLCEPRNLARRACRRHARRARTPRATLRRLLKTFTNCAATWADKVQSRHASVARCSMRTRRNGRMASFSEEHAVAQAAKRISAHHARFFAKRWATSPGATIVTSRNAAA
jgi:hypothetical protein